MTDDPLNSPHPSEYDDPTNVSPGELRDMRARAFLTQEQLAMRADVARSTVRDIENGDRPTPRHETMKRILDALAASLGG